MSVDTAKQEKIKETALHLARTEGLVNLTKEGLCDAVGMLPGNFNHVMGQSFDSFVEDLRKKIGPQPEFTETVRQRLNPNLRKEQLLNTALSIAENIGYTSVFRFSIADALNISPGLVRKYYPTIPELYEAIMKEAVSRKILSIIGTGIALKHPIALAAPKELRDKALQSLATNG